MIGNMTPAFPFPISTTLQITRTISAELIMFLKNNLGQGEN